MVGRRWICAAVFFPVDTQTDVQPYGVSIEYVRRIALQTMRREKRRTFIPLQPTRIPPDMLVR